MTRLYNLVAEAIKQAPSIVVPRSKVAESQGHSESVYKALGLSRNDLKRLERGGLAIRGYVPHKPVYAFPKDAAGNPQRVMTKHAGFRVRWVIVREG